MKEREKEKEREKTKMGGKVTEGKGRKEKEIRRKKSTP